MKLYTIKTPRIIMRLFSNYTWCFPSDKKEIYLTFDDGPTPKVTDFVLNELKEYNAKATFFCIGKNIVNHPEIFKRIINQGHSIGNHTNNHLNGWKTSLKEYILNIENCSKAIHKEKHPTKNVKLFRPPYGKIKRLQGQKLLKKGYKIIMWNVLSADFDTISKEKCLQNVLKNTSEGSIVVFHDSLKANEKLNYVLPKVLEFYTKKGYIFKAIS